MKDVKILKFPLFFSVVTAVALSGCDAGSTSAPKPVSVASTGCFLDSVGGSNSASVHVKPGIVDFSGWAVDSKTSTSPEQVSLILKDSAGVEYSFDKANRFERPDLVSLYKQEGYLKSGFSLKVDVSTLKPSTYNVIIKMSEGASSISCAVEKTVVVGS
ncbi:hypothetical protein JFT85_24040 [Pseudomonas sp. TH04]|uniref:hypothetical protein n=1 Tax=Pseudomonas sp. TH04 TaxID=2796370 RepID=UPI0019132FD2|nr:hypothetical protein [Pseudomonas sp. TH04]MBK5547838.1 hypothetical protein [Pseudomonas sp. TH04]